MITPDDSIGLDGNEQRLQGDSADGAPSTSHPPSPVRLAPRAASTPVNPASGKTVLQLSHPKAEAIILAAVRIADRDRRDGFIEEVCQGDVELQSEVKRVVRRHFTANGSFFAAPTVAETTWSRQGKGRRTGEWVGPYQLLNLIGEGGMGKVFVAEQFEPIHRRVALKMIKPGMDSAEVIARFEAERQALAMMEHPYIAAVLDAGVSEKGTPYFVMEYVRGLPITEYCDLRKLSLNQRIELFIDVCHGVQHAHLKGIIHRDLKPSNVLIASHDDHPSPKIIDFGIAKAIGQSLSGRSIQTRFSQFVGTPLYMSPEQAGLDELDIDTRSDIYSLGILLFELLTGGPPVSKEVMSLHGEAEVRRIVREEDSPIPSSRCDSLKPDEVSLILANRGLNEQTLRSALRGDLDCILLKALEKDRDQRYESASALAADLRRYLNQEPVLASPPTVLYRAQKFIRRKKATLLTVAMVALSLFVGTGIAVWQAIRANLNAHQLIAQAEIAKEMGRLAVEQRRRADLAEQEYHKESERAQELLYASSVRLASQHLQTGDSEQANRLLENWIPKPGQTDRRGIEWHLLHNQLNNFGDELLQLTGDVSSVRMSPDNTYVVAATDGGLIWRYSLTEQRPLICWPTRLTDVRRMEFSPDGAYLAVISYEAEVVVIETATGQMHLRCPSPALSTKNADICFFKGQLLTTGNSGDISVWDLTSRQLSQIWKTGCKLILDIETSPDQSLLVLLSDNGNDSEYRVNLLTQIGQDLQQRFLALTFCPCSVALHPNSTLVAVGGLMGELEVWDIRKPVRHRKWSFVEKLNELEFSADGRFLAIAERSGAIHVLDWKKANKPCLDENHQVHFNWAAHRRPARTVIFTPDFRYVITSGIDGRVVKWPRDNKATSRMAAGKGDWELLALPAAGVLASFSHRTLRLNRLKELEAVTEKTFPPEQGAICEVISNEAQNRLAISTGSKQILIGRMEEPFNFVPLPMDTSRSVENARMCYLSDDASLITVDSVPELRIQAWNCDTRQLVFTHEYTDVIPRQIVVSRHEYSVWVLTEDALLRFDLTGDGEMDRWPISGRDVKKIAISPNGKTLSVAHSDRRIELIDVDSKQIQLTIFGHVGAVEKMAFTRDAKTLITLDAGAHLRFWNVSNGTELLSWNVPVKQFDLSQDDQILSVHYEDVIELFDLTLQE